MAKWIEFRELPQLTKTRRWGVVTKDGMTPLGSVRWYGPFRRYSFLPVEGTVYEQDCLRNIAAFIEARTQEHKQAAAEAGR